MSNEAAAAENQNSAAQAGAAGSQGAADAGASGDAGAAAGVKPVVSTTPPAKEVKSDAKADGQGAADKSLLDQAKADGEKKEADGTKKTDGAGDKPVVPEKYELKAPEGMTLDQAAMDKFTPVAKELGLTNEAAQKLVNLQGEIMKAQQESQDQNFNEMVKNTRAETLKFYQDQQKNGGASIKEEMVYVAKGRDSFASPELIDLLNASGLSDHKAVITMFAKLGRQISEDKHVEGSRKTSSEVTAKDLFPSMNQQ